MNILDENILLSQRDQLRARKVHGRQILAKIPESLAEEIRTCQLYLTTEKKLAPGSLQVVVAALHFPFPLPRFLL